MTYFLFIYSILCIYIFLYNIINSISDNIVCIIDINISWFKSIMRCLVIEMGSSFGTGQVTKLDLMITLKEKEKRIKICA